MLYLLGSVNPLNPLIQCCLGDDIRLTRLIDGTTLIYIIGYGCGLWKTLDYGKH
jgi:hypothetical protein